MGVMKMGRSSSVQQPQVASFGPQAIICLGNAAEVELGSSNCLCFFFFVCVCVCVGFVCLCVCACVCV